MACYGDSFTFTSSSSSSSLFIYLFIYLCEYGEACLYPLVFLQGGDLFDAIASATKFSEKEASMMIRNLASALFYLHSLNVVHRDIKPENLLVRDTSIISMYLKFVSWVPEIHLPIYHRQIDRDFS
jgi:serine/threonine protein kinase